MLEFLFATGSVEHVLGLELFWERVQGLRVLRYFVLGYLRLGRTLLELSFSLVNI